MRVLKFLIHTIPNQNVDSKLISTVLNKIANKMLWFATQPALLVLRDIHNAYKQKLAPIFTKKYKIKLFNLTKMIKI